jgi:hypothetical protein
MKVYGGCIEPGGMDLDYDAWTAPCPQCGRPSDYRTIDRCDGGCINSYRTVACDHCGHREGHDEMIP